MKKLNKIKIEIYICLDIYSIYCNIILKMADKRKLDTSESEVPKKPKVKDASFRQMLSRIQLKQSRMNLFFSTVCLSFRHRKLPFLPKVALYEKTMLAIEYHMLIDGGLAARVAMLLSMCVNSYKQPRQNNRKYSEWMISIGRRVASKLPVKFGRTNYTTAKTLFAKKNFALGLAFLDTAIEYKCWDACALKAYYLLHGREGIPTNSDLAWDTARKGAKKDSRTCQFMMSVLFSISISVTPGSSGDDIIHADYWLETALENDKSTDPKFEGNLENLAKGLLLTPLVRRCSNPESITPKQAYDKAINFFKSQPDCPECQYQQGLLLSSYCGRKDFQDCLENAAEQGHPEALYQLARMYFYGHIVQKDVDKCRHLLHLSTIAGSKSPQFFCKLIGLEM